MSRFPIRDIAERLASAADTEAVVDALLAYLRALQSDWHPTLALYDSTHERFEHVYQRERGRLERRDVMLPLDHLPARLVRKFVRPSAFFNASDRRSLLEKLFQNSPGYEPDRFEAPQIQPLTAPIGWRSCLCLPLNDRDELLGMVVVVSPQVNVFRPALVGELQPLRSLASLALARRLHASGRQTPESREATDQGRRMVHALQEQLRQRNVEFNQLSEEHTARGMMLDAVSRELESLRASVAGHHDDAVAVSRRMQALEEQTGSAAMLLNDAYAQLADAQSRLAELSRTMDFVREGFAVIAGDPDSASLSRSFIAWFCEQFQVERCSLMRMDDSRGDLRILAHRGMDPTVAGRVRVPMGHGVAGWVAQERKPVFVREREDASPVAHTGQDSYNSDSFISVPLVHRRRLVGVLNLSNKHDGEAFDQLDLERAQLAGSVLAMALGDASDEACAAA